MENKIKATLVLAVIAIGTVTSEVKLGNPLLHAYPCEGSEDITSSFEIDPNPEKNNNYNVYINKQFCPETIIVVTFDADASVTLNDPSYAKVSQVSEGRSFEIKFFKSSDGVSFAVKGLTCQVPYITSILIDNEEYCSQPFVGYLDQYVKMNEDLVQSQ